MSIVFMVFFYVVLFACYIVLSNNNNNNQFNLQRLLGFLLWCSENSFHVPPSALTFRRLHVQTVSPPLSACERHCDVITHRKLHIKLAREGDKHPQPEAALMRIWDDRWKKEDILPGKYLCLFFGSVSWLIVIFVHHIQPPPPQKKFKVTPLARFPFRCTWSKKEIPSVAHTRSTMV